MGFWPKGFLGNEAFRVRAHYKNRFGAYSEFQEILLAKLGPSQSFFWSIWYACLRSHIYETHLSIVIPMS